MISPLDIYCALSASTPVQREGIGCGCTGILPGVLGAGKKGVGQAVTMGDPLAAAGGFVAMTPQQQTHLQKTLTYGTPEYFAALAQKTAASQTAAGQAALQAAAKNTYQKRPGYRPKRVWPHDVVRFAGMTSHDGDLGANQVLYEKIEFCTGGKLESLGSVLDGFSRAYLASLNEFMAWYQNDRSPARGGAGPDWEKNSYTDGASNSGEYKNSQGLVVGWRFGYPYAKAWLEHVTGKPYTWEGKQQITLKEAIDRLVATTRYQVDPDCFDHAQSFAASMHRQISEGVFGDCGAYTVAVSTLAKTLTGSSGLWVLLGDERDPAQHIVNLFVVKDADGHEAAILIDATATPEGGQPNAQVIGYMPPEKFTVFSIVNPNDGTLIATNWDPSGVKGVACGVRGECGMGIGYAGGLMPRLSSGVGFSFSDVTNPLKKYVTNPLQNIYDETRRGLDSTGKLLEKVVHASRKPLAQLAAQGRRVTGQLNESTGLPLGDLAGGGMGLPLLAFGPAGYLIAGATNPITQKAIERAASGDLSAKRLGADFLMGLGSYYHAASVGLNALGLGSLTKFTDLFGNLAKAGAYALNPDLLPRIDTPGPVTAPVAEADAGSSGGTGFGGVLLVALGAMALGGGSSSRSSSTKSSTKKKASSSRKRSK